MLSFNGAFGTPALKKLLEPPVVFRLIERLTSEFLRKHVEVVRYRGFHFLWCPIVRHASSTVVPGDTFQQAGDLEPAGPVFSHSHSRKLKPLCVAGKS